jgi:hypothetical protein
MVFELAENILTDRTRQGIFVYELGPPVLGELDSATIPSDGFTFPEGRYRCDMVLASVHAQKVEDTRLMMELRSGTNASLGHAVHRIISKTVRTMPLDIPASWRHDSDATTLNLALYADTCQAVWDISMQAGQTPIEIIARSIGAYEITTKQQLCYTCTERG